MGRIDPADCVNTAEARRALERSPISNRWGSGERFWDEGWGPLWVYRDGFFLGVVRAPSLHEAFGAVIDELLPGATWDELEPEEREALERGEEVEGLHVRPNGSPSSPWAHGDFAREELLGWRLELLTPELADTLRLELRSELEPGESLACEDEGEPLWDALERFTYEAPSDCAGPLELCADARPRCGAHVRSRALFELETAARALLKWASAPGSHGANPYGFPMVKLAERGLALLEERSPEDWAGKRRGAADHSPGELMESSRELLARWPHPPWNREER